MIGFTFSARHNFSGAVRAQRELFMSNLMKAGQSIGGDKTAPMAEIPGQLQRLSYDTNDLRCLLADLHVRLGPVMPSAVPETDGLAACEQSPETDIGQQIAEQSRLIRNANASVRNLLERIRL